MSQKPITRGQFHDVILETDYVIAIARTSSAAERIADRARKLDAAYALLKSGMIPCVREIQADRIVMTRVPGGPIASQLRGDPDLVQLLAGELSSFLSKMRQVDLHRARVLGIPTSDVARWQAFSEDVHQSLFQLMSPAGRDKAESELASVTSLSQPVECLAHGDLGGENLLFTEIDGVPRLSGVVDWDSVHIGDQAVDLASLAATFGTNVVEIIVARSGIDESIMPRISAIRDTFALQQALAGFQDDDEAEMLDGLAGYV